MNGENGVSWFDKWVTSIFGAGLSVIVPLINRSKAHEELDSATEVMDWIYDDVWALVLIIVAGGSAFIAARRRQDDHYGCLLEAFGLPALCLALMAGTQFLD